MIIQDRNDNNKHHAVYLDRGDYISEDYHGAKNPTIFIQNPDAVFVDVTCNQGNFVSNVELSFCRYNPFIDTTLNIICRHDGQKRADNSPKILHWVLNSLLKSATNIFNSMDEAESPDSPLVVPKNHNSMYWYKEVQSNKDCPFTEFAITTNFDVTVDQYWIAGYADRDYREYDEIEENPDDIKPAGELSISFPDRQCFIVKNYGPDAVERTRWMFRALIDAIKRNIEYYIDELHKHAIMKNERDYDRVS